MLAQVLYDQAVCLKPIPSYDAETMLAEAEDLILDILIARGKSLPAPTLFQDVFEGQGSTLCLEDLKKAMVAQGNSTSMVTNGPVEDDI